MRLSENIKSLRVAQGWTQEVLGEKLNISRQTISKWETGKSFPDVENLISLSTLFGVTLDELVGITREELPLADVKKHNQKRKVIVMADKIMKTTLVAAFLLIVTLCGAFYFKYYHISDSQIDIAGAYGITTEGSKIYLITDDAGNKVQVDKYGDVIRHSLGSKESKYVLTISKSDLKKIFEEE